MNKNIQNIIFFVLIIIIIYLGNRSPCLQPNKNETFVNMYGDFIDGPFFEGDDRQCRQTCNNITDCKGYSYDPKTNKCHLHSGKRHYILPYSDNFIYPWFDPYLYDNSWWLYANYDSPKVLSEEKALLPEKNGLIPLEILNKGRTTTRVIPPWTHENYFERGYRNNRYEGRHVHHYKNNEMKKDVEMSGRIGKYLGGGHGGRVRGNLPSDNELKYIF